MDGEERWMDGRKNETKRELRAAVDLISRMNVLLKNAKLLHLHPSVLRIPPSSFPMGMHISVLLVYAHLPPRRTSLARILHMQAQVGQAWTLCVIWFTVRRASFFLGSTLRPLLPLFCPRRPMWHLLHHFSTLFRHPNAFCTSLRSALPTSRYVWMTFMASQSIIVQCLLDKLQCYMLCKCQVETTRSSLTSCSYHRLLRSSFVK